MKGIYGYWDNKKEMVVYIGKDSNITNNKREYEHKAPSKYNNQPFNKILQKNPNRYKYFELCRLNCTENQLNELEQQAIELFKTYWYDNQEKQVFNFTKGGDGSNGYKHTPNSLKKMKKAKIGINNPNHNGLNENHKRNIGKSNSKYTLWNPIYCHYDKHSMFEKNRTPNPINCFRVKYKGHSIPIGSFKDFITCKIINNLIMEET